MGYFFPCFFFITSSLSFYYLINWASGVAKAPWRLADLMEEMRDLACLSNDSFHHVKCNANSKADGLAKEVQVRQRLIIANEDISLPTAQNKSHWNLSNPLFHTTIYFPRIFLDHDCGVIIFRHHSSPKDYRYPSVKVEF